jgi:hypothetical protein
MDRYKGIELGGKADAIKVTNSLQNTIQNICLALGL